MTNDSHLFWTQERPEQEGAYPSGLGRWRKANREWLPLYEGKMVQAFDHRAADVVVNLEKIHRPAQPVPLSERDHTDPSRLATPQYCVPIENLQEFEIPDVVIGFEDVTSPTNERSMIAAFLPCAGYGNTIPILNAVRSDDPSEAALWLGCLNSFVFDFCARSKIRANI